MKQEKLFYNELTDISEVDQYGYVNLIECLANGQVPASISNTEDEYNEIDDPSSILGKPSDVFDAYNMMDYIESNGAKVVNGQTE